MLAISEYSDTYDVDSQLDDAIDWLKTKQNIDGGFGEGSSTVFETACAFMAILNVEPAYGGLQDALDYLNANQDVDGSFLGEIYSTAVGALALNTSSKDSDGDGVEDMVDNCPEMSNPGQEDNDGDGRTVSVYDAVCLDGTGSYDPNGDDLSYNWSIISKPEGSDAELDNPISDQPCFTADKVGDYVVQLIVNDGELDSEPDTVTISAEGNTAPVAEAGTDQTVAVGENVFLDGIGSLDPDDDPISFTWSIISKPEESLAELDDAAIINPCFTADKVGDYVVQLIVNDGELDSDPDTVVITAKESGVIEIDIKPGSCPNPISLKSKGVLPVAILGTEDFHVEAIDLEAILLSREGIEEGIAPIRYSYEDVATPFEGELCGCHDRNGDGYMDLTLKFETQELIEQLELNEVAGETISLTLSGNLKEEDGGNPVAGEDCVWVLKQGN